MCSISTRHDSILGTGCNGAYIEKLSNIEKWKGESAADEMIINMEFGAFDKERVILPLTMFDNKMDRKSVVSRRDPPACHEQVNTLGFSRNN